MRQPVERQKGAQGQTFTKLYFEGVGCGPFDAGDHDLGTDLYVALRTEQGIDDGVMVGIQVKTGQSFFKDRGQLDGADGYWYRFDQDHANYWRNHILAHALVLVSSDLQSAIWAPLDNSTMKSTGEGFKVFVPSHQRLDGTGVDAWFRLALSRRQEIAYKGLSWRFRITDRPTREWARLALVVPRLVAPHPNRGNELEKLNWAEAAALCVRAESGRWRDTAAVRPAIPAIEEARSQNDAGWRFAAFVHDWCHGTLEESEDAPEVCLRDSQLAVPTQIIHAMHRLDERGPVAALAVISAEPELPTSREDAAWLALLRCRFLEEASMWSDALEQIHAADVHLALVTQDDLSVDALRSGVVSARMQHEFSYEAFTRGLTAADNPVGWWRSQRIASALEAAVHRIFKQHGRSNDDWSGDELVHNRLVSAALAARVAGAWPAYRSIEGLIGRCDFLLSEQDEFRPLNSLRKSGDHDALASALRVCLSDGRSTSVVDFVSTLTAERSTSSTLRADLAAVRQGFTTLAPDKKQAWATRLLGFIAGTETLPLPRRTSLLDEILDTICVLADELTPIQVEALGDWLLGAGGDDEQSWNAQLRLAAALRTSSSLRARWLDILRDTKLDSHRRSVLRTLTRGEKATRSEAELLLQAADLDGLSAIERWTELSIDEARGALAGVQKGVSSLLSEGDSISIPAKDWGQQLAALVLYGRTGSEGWCALRDFLSEDRIFPGFKEAAARLLLNNQDDIPGDELGQLVASVGDAAQQMRSESPFRARLGPFPRRGYIEVLELALGRQGDDFWNGVVQFVSDPSVRIAAVNGAGLRAGGEMLLVGLLVHPDSDVRAWACVGLTRRVLESEHANASWTTALIQHVERVGIQAAQLIRAVASDLSKPEALPRALEETVSSVLSVYS